MFAKIMRYLGYVPFEALVQAERDAMLHSSRAKKADEEIVARDETINRIRTREANTVADNKRMGELLNNYGMRSQPHIFVKDEPKRLSLVLARNAIDPAPVILKQGVRNKANEAHYADLMKQANTLISEAFAIVNASPVKDEPHKTNPHAGIPMTDKPR